MNPTDQELVVRIRGGSAEAFGFLVRRYERPIHGLVRRMVRDPVLAEDIAQEIFLKAYNNLERYDPHRPFKSWLFKIAHNATIDHLRRKRLPTVPLEAQGREGDESWEVLPAPAADQPHQVLERRNILSGLDRALSRMPDQYREILLLRFQQGLAYHEIADVTGQKMGTVKIQLHRARKRLSDELRELGIEPGGPTE